MEFLFGVLELDTGNEIHNSVKILKKLEIQKLMNHIAYEI